MATYNLNTETARQADGPGYIQVTGKYKGKLTLAKAIESTKGTTGIEFAFEDESGQKANYLSIWTHKANGEELSGNRTVNAIMTVTRTKTMSGKPFVVKGKDGDETVEAYTDLHGKPIGLLLAREPYDKNDGSEGNKMVIEGVFDPESELTASEILDRKTNPEKLSQMVMRLKDRPKQVRTGQAPQRTGNAVADLEDDSIPF